MRYVLSRIRVYQREEAYRIYISDALKGFLGLNTRLYDILYPTVETRTATGIIEGIKAKLRG
jgi:hypothetical protein